MKRFLVFCIGWYYPNGGLGDFDKSFATLDEAINYVNTELFHTLEGDCSAHIFDRIDCILYDEVRERRPVGTGSHSFFVKIDVDNPKRF